ncbi:hypothetical protein KGQ34_02280 [Patescibacteria group bacterium]|nr:hypothetical protein [Patescibacteria group bacterium]
MFSSLFVQFLAWHYGDGLKDTVRNGINAVIGFLNYFSVLELSRTLFSPWHRIVESYGRGFDPGEFFFTLAGNLISRVIGAGVRAVVIVVGLLVSFTALVSGLCFIIIWFVMPLLIPVFFLWGLAMVF